MWRALAHKIDICGVADQHINTGRRRRRRFFDSVCRRLHQFAHVLACADVGRCQVAARGLRIPGVKRFVFVSMSITPPSKAGICPVASCRTACLDPPAMSRRPSGPTGPPAVTCRVWLERRI